MGMVILGALCIAGEGFLIYFLIQLFRDSQRVSRSAAARNSHRETHTPQFAQFEVTPPTSKAVWREGEWLRVDLPGSAVSAPELEGHWRRVRHHA